MSTLLSDDPLWYKDAVIYQLHVKAFADSNNDGIPQTNEWDKENNLTGAATPDGIPDAYFESSNVDDLQDKLLATIASILRRWRISGK